MKLHAIAQCHDNRFRTVAKYGFSDIGHGRSISAVVDDEFFVKIAGRHPVVDRPAVGVHVADVQRRGQPDNATTDRLVGRVELGIGLVGELAGMGLRDCVARGWHAHCASGTRKQLHRVATATLHCCLQLVLSIANIDGRASVAWDSAKMLLCIESTALAEAKVYAYKISNGSRRCQRPTGCNPAPPINQCCSRTSRYLHRPAAATGARALAK